MTTAGFNCSSSSGRAPAPRPCSSAPGLLSIHQSTSPATQGPGNTKPPPNLSSTRAGVIHGTAQRVGRVGGSSEVKTTLFFSIEAV